jgi:hypothetical protein
MTITTERVEECARGQDSIEKASMYVGYKSIAKRCAATLRSLAAERDALRAEVERPESGVSYEAFVSAMQIVTTERDALQAENARLREALEKLARLGAEPYYGNSDGNMIARAALGEKE